VIIKGISWNIDLAHKQLVRSDNPKVTRKMEDEYEVDHFRELLKGGSY